jgi:RND family efflux transporter MFP subunit
MKPNLFISLLCLFILLLSSCSAEKEQTGSSIEVSIAQVQTLKLQNSDISATLTVYGSVMPLPSALKTLSVPFACRIKNIKVTNGQAVRKGDPLLTVQPGEDALLAVTQAQQELSAAKQEQKLLQERISLKLATQHELVTSQLRVAQAKALVQDLTSRGATQTHTLTADSSGVISLVNVQQGQRLPAASPLLQWLEQNQWGVSFGVEPENFGQLRLQQEVFLMPVNRAVVHPIRGRIELITQQIDPLTHLITILVRPDAESGLLLNELVQGRITVSSKRTLVAPRAAVLPDADAYSLFTVVQGHAVKHRVQLGIENDKQVEIIGATLKEQDDMVVLGNYELQDGMAVEIKQP